MVGNFLVRGGAGYIDSHMCNHLARSESTPVTFDSLSTGHQWAGKWDPLVEGHLLHPTSLAMLSNEYRIDAVMHFTARPLVGESMQELGLYFRNNVTGNVNLMDAMRAANVDWLVFSSTVAVYGNPEYMPIDEAHSTRPSNPYGWSKLMAERQIAEYCNAHGLRAVCLRYSNVEAADPEGEVGEAHEPESHLILNVINAVMDPSRGQIQVYGDDYDTPDDTCIREYTRVKDLCSARLMALEYLAGYPGFHVSNLEASKVHSIVETVAACRAIFGGCPEMEVVSRRQGDPATLVASCGKSSASIPVDSRGLEDCILDASNWRRSQTLS